VGRRCWKCRCWDESLRGLVRIRRVKADPRRTRSRVHCLLWTEAGYGCPTVHHHSGELDRLSTPNSSLDTMEKCDRNCVQTTSDRWLGDGRNPNESPQGREYGRVRGHRHQRTQFRLSPHLRPGKATFWCGMSDQNGPISDRRWRTDHKRIEHLCRQEGLKVPQKQPKRRRLWFPRRFVRAAASGVPESRVELRPWTACEKSSLLFIR
jgi:hypothetical protein